MIRNRIALRLVGVIVLLENFGGLGRLAPLSLRNIAMTCVQLSFEERGSFHLEIGRSRRGTLPINDLGDLVAAVTFLHEDIAEVQVRMPKDGGTSLRTLGRDESRNDALVLVQRLEVFLGFSCPQ